MAHANDASRLGLHQRGTRRACRCLQVAGVFTFGAPAVGDAEFAARFDRAFAGRCARFVAEGDIVPRLPLLPAAAACAGGGPRPRSGYAHHAGLREVPRAADAAAAAVVAGPRRRKLPAPAVVCEVSVSAVGGGVAGAKRAGGARAGMGRGLPGRSERGVLARAAAAGAEVAGAAAAAAALAALGAAMPGVVANRPQEYVRALQAVAALA